MTDYWVTVSPVNEDFNSATGLCNPSTVHTFTFMVQGYTMHLVLYAEVTLTSLASSNLKVKIPGDLTATNTILDSCYVEENGVKVPGYLKITKDSTEIEFYKLDGTPWAITLANTHAITANILLEVKEA
jgi:hypothetical protein